jgi:ABC-type transport system involved in cytochrome c biogenesis permease subunit
MKNSKIYIPLIVLNCALLMVLGMGFRPESGIAAEVRELAKLPVIDGGRIKPLDSVARVDLRVMNGREYYIDENGDSQPAIKMFLDAASANDPTVPFGEIRKARIFRIELDQLRNFLGLEYREGVRYSISEFQGKMKKLLEKTEPLEKKNSKTLDDFERACLKLKRHAELLFGFNQGGSPLLVPPTAKDPNWRRMLEIRREADKVATMKTVQELNLDKIDREKLSQQQKEELIKKSDELYAKAEADFLKDYPILNDWDDLMSQYRAKDWKQFHESFQSFKTKYYAGITEKEWSRSNFEYFLNRFAPFYQCLILYVIAGILCVISWLATGFHEQIRRSVFAVLVLATAIQIFGLISRMILMDRPLVFVTNLYSSAIFIGAACVLLCLLIELLYPLGISNLVASVAGFLTCILAHNYLSADGDTLEMMVAVLDTNFWLATHVTTVTLGYTTTFVAGLMGVVYIIRGFFTPSLTKDLGRSIYGMTYGTICFATLLSFVGTVLGGIWADQSWGRFWGWDSKENGAALVVLWNALILHARWGGIVKERGVMVLAVVGSMITFWSWFGTNQLQAGLHTYGFSSELAVICRWFWLTHAAVVVVGILPMSWWASREDLGKK